MGWGLGEADLIEQVRERQRKTIETYAIDPDLLEEHVGMEDNFQAGGYGERQVEELLQNAVDQLPEPGRVELRLLNGVLYCANEGQPFTAAGIRAVTHAFLSSKKEEADEKIGRFGLGFKSVLGVTDRPQVISRSVSFGFNEPEVRALLADLPHRPERVPTLRVPSVLDPRAIGADDPNVGELMEWATTIIRLPLVRGADRMRKRLQDFDPRYMLFPDNLARTDIVLADASGSREVRTFQRRTAKDEGTVQLVTPAGAVSTWRVLRKEHQVTEDVAKALPGLFRRDRVTVSYALEQGKSGTGEFWSWFPLQDKTTASGIFNAPWQVNDDRTSMLPNSALNGELLEVAAGLLIDAALLESSPSDPAKHFDVLPARGKEIRSAADGYMSSRIPQLARRHELIPTATGEMRSPMKVRAPIVASQSNRFALPKKAVELWVAAAGASDVPHPSCYTTATRALRLSELLTDENDRIACKTVSPSTWLAEAARDRTVQAINAALEIYRVLRSQDQALWSQFSRAAVIPIDDGTVAPLSDASTVLLPVAGADSPPDIRLVDPAFADHAPLRAQLVELGVREVSKDQVAATAAVAATNSLSDEEWSILWARLVLAGPEAAKDAISGMRSRGIGVKVPTKSGDWRTASEVFLDADSVPGLPWRQADVARLRGRADLLTPAGCLDGLAQNFPVVDENAFSEYSREMNSGTARAVREQVSPSAKATLRFRDRRGIGPLDVLLELSQSDDPRARSALVHWTDQLLDLLLDTHIDVELQIRGEAKPRSMKLESPEYWCAKTYGRLNTSLGPQALPHVVAGSLRRFEALLPVATKSYAPIFEPADDLSKVPRHLLEGILSRDDYELTDHALLPELLEVACRRGVRTTGNLVPAIDPQTARVRLTAAQDIVLANPNELEDLGSHNLRYLPSGSWDDALIAVWSLPRAADVVARSIDWTAVGDGVPLVDVYPTLPHSVDRSIEDIVLQRCSAIVRRTTSPAGVQEKRLPAHLDRASVLVDDDLDHVATLHEASRVMALGLTEAEAASIVENDAKLRRTKLVRDVDAEPDESAKLLLLVGREQLAENLPRGLLGVIEQRQGRQSDTAVAELFLTTYGNDSLRRLKALLGATGMVVPTTWAGSAEAEQFVTSLGFPRAFAGVREKKAPSIELVPGKVELKPLHDFQEDLSKQIRKLVLKREKDGTHRRGLLYLPTGAGKTRVSTESIVAMLRDDELAAPVLWIAQSEELCEQAILSWTEVWRAIGDERPLEISRFWGNHEVDESLQELQVVVATDAKLASMIGRGSRAHTWLQESRLVVIDEAHTAGSPTYTSILKWLGITNRSGAAQTDRPLLGLTATPYRGTNKAINEQFVQRFGKRRLNALDEDDPIKQLRDMQVLSEVEHQVLDGVVVTDSPTEGASGTKAAWDDVSRAILRKLGENLDRTELLVDHVMSQDPDWPILVFTPSVVAAHVTAALLRSLGRPSEAVDGEMRGQERRRKIDAFKAGDTKVLVNCDLLTQGFDAPKVRALYIARPTFSPNRYVQMVGRGLRGPRNGGTSECLVVNVEDTFTQFDKSLAYTQFDYLWAKSGRRVTQ